MSSTENLPVKREPGEMLKALIGTRVTRVSLEEWSVVLLFDDCELRIEGKWQVSDDRRLIQDQEQDLRGRTEFLLWKLVSKVVSDVTSDEVRLEIRFTDGWQIRAFSSDTGFEDWTVATFNGMLIICNGTVISTFPGARASG